MSQGPWVKREELTIEATRHRVMILDEALIDEDALCAVAGCDGDGVVGCVDLRIPIQYNFPEAYAHH